MSQSYDDSLSTRIRLGKSTPEEEALADAAPELLAACLAFVELDEIRRIVRRSLDIPLCIREQFADAIAKAKGDPS